MARTFDPALTGQQSSPCLTEDLGFVMMVRLLSFHVDYCRFILFHPAICIKLSCPFLDILCVVHVDQKCPSWLDNYTDFLRMLVCSLGITHVPSNGHLRITVFFPVWEPPRLEGLFRHFDPRASGIVDFEGWCSMMWMWLDGTHGKNPIMAPSMQ